MRDCPEGFDPNDWKAAPHAAWAFRNVEEFLPTRIIAAPPGALAIAQAEPAAFVPRLMLEGQERPWSDYRDAVSATSMLIVADGRITYQWYRHPMGPEEHHTLFSITKSVVGLAALLLSQQGRLDLSAKVKAYVPALAGSPFGEAVVDDLLAMRDGVLFDENYADPRADIHLYSRHYWGGAPGGALAALQRQPKRPGRAGQFAYRTPVADVLGWVLRGASGQSLAPLIAELIWEPIGAEADALLICDTAGEEIAGTGLTARPRDLARLALALLAGEGSPFPETVRDRLFAGGDPAAVASAGYVSRPGWSYANLSWSPAPGQIAAMGVHGQKMFVDRSSGTALIVTAAVPSADVRHLDGWHEAAFRAVRELA